MVGEGHFVKSFFISGNYNLTINYTTVVSLNQNAPLFTIEIREYHASIRDIQLSDNLNFPFTLLSAESLFATILFYFILSDETWNQINDIKILDREHRNRYYSKKSKIDLRFLKIPSFIKNRRFSLVLVSYLLIFYISYDIVDMVMYLIYSLIICILMAYESVPQPGLDYIIVTERYIEFKYRNILPFILEKFKVKKVIFKTYTRKVSEGTELVKELEIESNEGLYYHIRLKRKVEKTIMELQKFSWFKT